MHNNHNPRAFLRAAYLVAVLLCPRRSGADPWPQWRGPTRDGISAETSGWPAAWPPRQLWRTCVGEGCTSPVIADGTLYVLGWSGKGPGRPRDNPVGTDTLFAFDAHTGKELWRQGFPCRYQGRVRNGDLSQYGGPTATPAVDLLGKRIYTLSVDGDLAAWSLRDKGRLLWHINLYDTYTIPARPHVCDRSPNDYGCTSSPLLHSGQLLIEVGAAEGLVMAFDPKTGKRLWASEACEPAGHTGSIVPFRAPTGEALAVLSLTNLVVIRLDKGHLGKTFARQPWKTDFACNIPCPTMSENRMLLTCGYNHKTTEAFDLSASGGFTPAWTSRTAHAVVTTPVLRDGRAYVLGGTMACLDLANGNVAWKGGQFGHGSMIATSDNKLIACGNGRLALLDIAPGVGSYTELSLADKVLPDTCYPHLALSDGLLTCKDRAGNLVAFDLQPTSATR